MKSTAVAAFTPQDLFYAVWRNRRTGVETRSAQPLLLEDLDAWTSPSEDLVALQADRRNVGVLQ